MEALRQRLAEYGQAHLLDNWDQLDAASRARLTEQLDAIDFAQLQSLIEHGDTHCDWQALARRAESPPAIRCQGENRFSRQEAQQAGDAALRGGRVAALLVAGGQGTRLGFPHPKGLYPIGPLSQRTLFQIFADQLRAAQRYYQVTIPLLLMTSPATHAATVAYWRDQQYLGLNPASVDLFCQGTMPAVDSATGRILLEAPDQICLSPDGHGGTLAALARHGGLQRLESLGIEHLFYFQVDNPLVRVCDPEFIGYHVLAKSEMSTQVVAKRDPLERVGNIVSVDGKLQVIEYSDLPAELAERRHADGSLVMWAGNTAVHVFARSFLQRAEREAMLPFHRARKKVACLDEQGKLREPETPNAIKFERFIFDLMPLAAQSLVMEVNAAECFAPVKNAPGAPTDSPDTARAAMLHLHRQWLLAAGKNVEHDVEIHPLFAKDGEELRQRDLSHLQVTGPTYLCEA